MESLGGVLSSRPNAVSWAANRIDIVARGMDFGLLPQMVEWQQLARLESLGGQIQHAPTICSWGNGRLDIFALGTNYALFHKWYQGGWSGWENLGGQLSTEPTAVSWEQPDRYFCPGHELEPIPYVVGWCLAWMGESLGGIKYQQHLRHVAGPAADWIFLHVGLIISFGINGIAVDGAVGKTWEEIYMEARQQKVMGTKPYRCILSRRNIPHDAQVVEWISMVRRRRPWRGTFIRCWCGIVAGRQA